MTNKPLHIGLIPDGTRRWARSNSKSLTDAYFHMVTTISQSIDLFYQQNAETVAVYMLSTENLKRNSDELQIVLEAETYFVETLLPPLVKKYSLSVAIAGNLGLLPDKVAGRIQSKIAVMGHGRRTLYLCLAYNPLDELNSCLLARQSFVADTKELLAKLWVPHQLDMVIRTSGEQRLSNFLPLQSAYAELFFISEFINDVTKDKLLECIRQFQDRRRRFGN